ncbi:MAG: NADPH:quinone reductase [Candidatus Omnitrophica bacterium]|nr:NADPH:quinone reductase [Candidatus Omnitrophota bacterium]
MKAIQVYNYGPPEVMKYEDVSDLVAGQDQILVEVKAIGVNPVETYIRSGMYPFQTKFPFTLGFDAAGIIKAIGGNVKKVKVGDRVYTDGTLSGSYAAEVLCAEHQIYSLPDKVSFEQGAALGIPFTTAYYALFNKASACADQTVLIHGASGAVGVAAVQIANHAGLNVFATAGSQEGLKLVHEQGAHEVFDHTRSGYIDAIMKATGDRGVDVALEMLANVNLGNDLKVLAKNGRVVIIGCRGDTTINPRDIMRTGGSVHGMVIFNATREEKEKIHAELFEGLTSGVLNPVIGKEFSLERAADAHTFIINSKAYGKVILVP